MARAISGGRSFMDALEPRLHLSAVKPLDDGLAIDNYSERASPAFRLLQRRSAASERTSSIGPQLSQIVAGAGATGRQPIGALTGKIVYTVGGHGFTSFSGGWHTQRGVNNGMVEDLGNQDQMTLYVDYLFNAGATVVPLRPVGYQPNEVVLDNDSPGVTFTGSWSNSVSTVFYGSAGDLPYRYASTALTETAVARFTPTIAQAGFYPVYEWTRDGTDRAVDTTFRVTHSGGSTEVKVNHRMVGKGWVYLGTYYFNAGASGHVEVSNKSATAGNVVIADAIRFGNGMGDIDRGLGVSGQTRSDESALYWIEAQRGQGVADTVFRGPGAPDSDDDDNVWAPPRWAAHMNGAAFGAQTDRLFLSFHSNAGGGTGRGTVGLYNGNNNPATRTPLQFEWANLVGSEVNDDMLAQNGQFEHDWFDRPGHTLDRSDIEFGEINNIAINDEFDATILEVAFHDNVTDAELMRDARVRDAVARASLQATIKYFGTYPSPVPFTLPPGSPGNVRAIVQPDGSATVFWSAPVANSYIGGTATGYVVYRSSDGYGFGNPIFVAGGGTLSVNIPAGQLGNAVNYFRVGATNAGGESIASEVVAARAGQSGANRVLIVNGFDRLDRAMAARQTTPVSYDPPVAPGSGSTFDRVRPRFSNSFDYVVQAGEAIESYTGGAVLVDSVQNEAVIGSLVDLADYKAVIWLSGEESTADDTFNATEQTRVTNYLAAGGNLFVSGAEIGWDLDFTGANPAFYNNTLKANFVADDSNSYNVNGAAGSIFAGLSMAFDNGTLFYNPEFPDVLAPLGGAVVAMSYANGTGGAAIQHAPSSAHSGRLVNFGFPFETITTVANRNAVMDRVLDFFGFDLGSIAGTIYKDVNGNGAHNAPAEPGLAGWTVFLDADGDGVLDGGEVSVVTARAEPTALPMSRRAITPSRHCFRPATSARVRAPAATPLRWWAARTWRRGTSAISRSCSTAADRPIRTSSAQPARSPRSSRPFPVTRQ